MVRKFKIIVIVFIFILLLIKNLVYIIPNNSNKDLFGDVINAKIGDVNGDGKISSPDYLMIKKYIVGNISLSDNQKKLADINSDGFINSVDYILVKKQILGISKIETPISKEETQTVSQPSVEVKKYNVKLIGMTVVETSYSNNVLLSSKDKVPVVESRELSLETNKEYFISFDYITSGGINEFNIDLYPDELPELHLKATTELQHYDWILSSNNSNIEKCKLRFFDDIQENNEQDITISNIKMGTLEVTQKNGNEKIGSLPEPKQDGYKFLGWYKASTDGEKVTVDTIVSSDMTLYAHWEKEETYTIGPGEGYYSKTVTYMGRTFKDYKQNRMPGGIPSGGCGPVSLLDILSGYDKNANINDILKITGLSTSFRYINTAARSLGLQHSKIYVYKSNNPNEGTVKAYTEIAIDALKKGHQLIVLVSRSSMCAVCNGLPYDAFSWGNHFIAIVGLKKDGETAIVLNPSEGKMEEGRMEDIIRYFLPGGPQSGFVEYWK